MTASPTYIPTPRLASALRCFGRLDLSRVPLYAAHWLAAHQGTALVDLAGLPGNSTLDVLELLPAALADCGTSLELPLEEAAGLYFDHLATRFLNGELSTRELLRAVDSAVAHAEYRSEVFTPLSSALYDMDDRWDYHEPPSVEHEEITSQARAACASQLNRLN